MPPPTCSSPGPEACHGQRDSSSRRARGVRSLADRQRGAGFERRSLGQGGGALLVADKDLTPQWLESELIPLLSDQQRLNAMARAAESLGIRNADQRMADLVLEAVSA